MQHGLRTFSGCPPRDLWRRFEAGRVDQPTLDALSHHLRDCLDCLELLEGDATRRRPCQTTLAGFPFVLESQCRQLQERATHLRVGTGEFTGAAGQRTSVEPDSLPERLGRYQVREVLGSGGFGRVYLADDPLLQRSVAIKVPRRNSFGTIGEMSDFLNEARHAAALDHPGIVPIFDVLEDEAGHALIVMKHIAGSTLSFVMRERPLSLREAVMMMARIARAVDFAHEQGFVHRDLKPANILIDTHGQPHVTDFGLGLNLHGANLSFVGRGGTPSHMAPEQIRHEVSSIDRRTDVWALGVMIAELATRRRLFGGETREEQFDRILNSPPDLPDDFDAELRRIVSNCLEKRVSDRTESALKLAEQLEAWLQQQDLASKRLSPRTKFLSVCAFLFLLAGAAFVWQSRGAMKTPENSQVRADINSHTPSTSSDVDSTAEPTQVAEPTSIPEPLNASAVAAVVDPKQWGAWSKLYAIDMRQAFEANAAGDVERLKSLLNAHIPSDGEPDVRGFEWHYLQQTMVPPHRTKHFVGWMGHVICVSPDGEHLAVGGPFAVKLLNAKTLEVEDTLWVLGEEVRALAYSPDGTQLAGTGHRGNVILWSTPEKKLILQHKAFSADGWGIAFTPDGQRLVASAGDGSIKSFKISKSALEEIHNLKIDITPGGVQGSFDLSPNGTLLATGSRDPHRVYFWNLETGQRLGERESLGAVSALHFSENGQRLMAGASTQRLYALGVSNPASAGIDWDTPYSKPIRDLRLSPNEVFVAIGGRDGEIQICRTPPTSPITLLPNPVVKTWQAHAPRLMNLKYLPDGNSLVSTGNDGKLHLWDLRDAVTLERLKHPIVKHTVQKRMAIFVSSDWPLASSSRSPLLLVADDRGLHIRDSETDEVVQTIEARSEGDAVAVEVTHLSTALNHRVAALYSDGRVVWWDHVGEAPQEPIRHELVSLGSQGHMALSPDGRWLALGNGGSEPFHEIHDLDGILPRQELSRGNVFGHRFTADSRRLIYIKHFNLCGYDMETQTTLFDVMAHSTHLHAMEVNAQGSMIATGNHNHEIKLWDSRTGQLLKSFPPGLAPVTALAFSPDGRSLVSADDSKTNKIWNVETGQHMGDLPSSNQRAIRLEFSTDGRHLLFRDLFHEYLLFRMPRQTTVN